MIPRLSRARARADHQGGDERLGAGCADYILLRLPHELTTLFCDWLDTHYPGQKECDPQPAAGKPWRHPQQPCISGPACAVKGNLPICWPSVFGSSASGSGLCKRHVQLRQDAFIRPGEQLTLF